MWSIQKKIIVIFITFLFLLLISFGVTNFKKPEINIPKYDFGQNPEPTFPENETQLVKKVIDGDTFELSNGQKVRMIGIDTPEVYNFGEPKECFSEEASDYTKSLIEGKIVRLEKDISDKDKYDRLLRYVYIEDTFINENLVKNGFAYAKPYPPDTYYQDIFGLAEIMARENKRGLWGKCLEN